jgi:DNA-binding MarR family transcriptional regulator
MTGRDGLAATISRLLVAFTTEFDNEFEHHMPHRTATFGPGGPEPAVSSSGRPMRRPWLASQAMWSNCLCFVGADGVPLGSLDGLGANLAGLKRWGYVVVGPDASAPAASGSGTSGPATKPRPEWLVRPSRAGRFAQAIWGRLEGAIERRWEQRFGSDLLAELRGSLLGVARQLDEALPLYLPVVTYADGMRTRFRAPSPGQLATAGAAGDPGTLGLSVLLARVLLTYTVDYERAAPLSLPVSANVLGMLGQAGPRVRDLPLLAGVSREAVSSSAGFLERHGYVEIGPDPAAARGQVITLTDRGRAARQAHGELCRSVEDGWRERFGAAGIGRLRDCLNQVAGHRTGDQPTVGLGLRPYPDGWRARGRYRAQSEAVLADPWAALPRQPMVLHRGGFPDGS